MKTKQYKIKIAGKDNFVSLEENLRNEATRLAQSYGMTFSGLVRYLLMKALQERK